MVRIRSKAERRWRPPQAAARHRMMDPPGGAELAYADPTFLPIRSLRLVPTGPIGILGNIRRLGRMAALAGVLLAVMAWAQSAKSSEVHPAACAASRCGAGADGRPCLRRPPPGAATGYRPQRQASLLLSALLHQPDHQRHHRRPERAGGDRLPGLLCERGHQATSSPRTSATMSRDSLRQRNTRRSPSIADAIGASSRPASSSAAWRMRTRTMPRC